MHKALCLYIIIGILFSSCAMAQKTQADSSFRPGGKWWAYSFGDYYYKAHADSLNRGSGTNQYNGIEKGRNAFQLRRLYLGYTYNISAKFTAEILLAAEENSTNFFGVTTGDLLGDNKLGFYVKWANLRWKNIWKRTDFIIGQVSTPAFSLTEEPIWGYRPVEKTIADFHRTPSFDLGAALQGKFDEKENFGYDLMVGNGTGARPENDKFKWFYGDVFAKFLNKRLVFDLYADYARLNRTANWHHSRNMIKGFVAYTTPVFTAGMEAFINHAQKDVVGIHALQKDTLSAKAKAISIFTRGRIIKDKLSFFARMDNFNPDVFYNDYYSSYQALTPTYEPNNKELFLTTGVDFTPEKNVHFIPNVWYERYTSNHSGLSNRSYRDYDLVYRITFSYVFK